MSRMRSITRPLLALAAPRGPQGYPRLQHGHPKDLAVMCEAHSDASGDGVVATTGEGFLRDTVGGEP